MKTHHIKIAICYFSDFVRKILPYRESFPSDYFRGKQTGTFRVTKDGPLPFAADIVAPTLKYGFKCFMKYPADIPDYFKQAFPEGLTYDRKLTFEDGGCATATVEMRWVIPYYLTSNRLFNLQIAQGSLIKKGNVSYLLVVNFDIRIHSIICEWAKQKSFKVSRIFCNTAQKFGLSVKKWNSRRFSMMNNIMEASKKH